ncbi:MAG: phosphoribosylglycinamide formyltransferase [Pseudomonadota bacterium]
MSPSFDPYEPCALCVFISGRGSNLGALLQQQETYRVALVITDNPDAKGLDLARAAGVAYLCHPLPLAAQGLRVIARALQAHKIERIALAGYMRRLPASFCRIWQGRIINIHPSLLPAFKGLDTHRRALQAGAKQHGASVHLVTPQIDAGTILGQAALDILSDDTPDTLAARVLVKEHILYPNIVNSWCLQ